MMGARREVVRVVSIDRMSNKAMVFALINVDQSGEPTVEVATIEGTVKVTVNVGNALSIIFGC